jgi:hypothetical protein
MSRNKCFFEVRKLFVLHFICICEPLVDSPSLYSVLMQILMYPEAQIRNENS